MKFASGIGYNSSNFKGKKNDFSMAHLKTHLERQRWVTLPYKSGVGLSYVRIISRTLYLILSTYVYLNHVPENRIVETITSHLWNVVICDTWNDEHFGPDCIKIFKCWLWCRVTYTCKFPHYLDIGVENYTCLHFITFKLQAVETLEFMQPSLFCLN